MRLIMFFFLVTVSTKSFSSGWLISEGWAKISTINVESGLVRITYTAEASLDPDACGVKGVAFIQDDTTNGDRQFSILLAAKMAQKDIRLYGNGCISGWGKQWPKVHAVFVR